MHIPIEIGALAAPHLFLGIGIGIFD